jgi:hypothetical protein
MRVLGFSKKWDKLNDKTFTTFRFPRKDRDWSVGEQVQIVFHPRGKDREIIGCAEIIEKLSCLFRPTIGYYMPTDEDARADGFKDYPAMAEWFEQTYGDIIYSKPINRLTLKNFIGCKTYKTKTECKDCTDLEGCTLIPDGKCFSKKS